MTQNDIIILADALLHKNHSGDCLKKINKVFRNKRCERIIKEFKLLVQNTKGREKNMALIIVVLALLQKDIRNYKSLETALTDEDLIAPFYGGLRMLLCGKNPSFHVNITFTDSYYPNEYRYITRFEGQFHTPEYHEILYAAKMLAHMDYAKFEELAFQDPTHLILYNLSSYMLDSFPSPTLITRLLKDGDTVQANIGFYYAVRHITMDIHDYAQLRNHPALPGAKTKKEIDQAIIHHLEELDILLQTCSPKRRTALLFNYILAHREYPIQFGHWLMQTVYQPFLIQQITASGKVRNLNDVLTITRLIHDFPCKNADGISQRKDPLYAAVVPVLKTFITERTGIYSWDSKEERIWQEICNSLPKRYIQRFCTFLKKISSGLMVSKLDEMVRFRIYLEEKRQWDICQGMMKICHR